MMNKQKVINAFDWRNFECPVTGKISWYKQNKEKVASMQMQVYVDKKRVTHPKHGTVFGISNKVVSVKPAEMMKR
jgi:hypothetical protein